MNEWEGVRSLSNFTNFIICLYFPLYSFTALKANTFSPRNQHTLKLQIRFLCPLFLRYKKSVILWVTMIVSSGRFVQSPFTSSITLCRPSHLITEIVRVKNITSRLIRRGGSRRAQMIMSLIAVQCFFHSPGTKLMLVLLS